MKEAIVQICEQQMFNKDVCVNRAQKFEASKKNEEYIELYEKTG